MEEEELHNQEESSRTSIWGWTSNVVEDKSAPLYYSRRAIFYFSLLCGMIFGVWMLTINFLISRNNKGLIWLLIFGIIYISGELLFLYFLPDFLPMLLVINFIGAYILNQHFWNKYIGRETKYRAKSIWFFLTLAVIFGFLVLSKVI